MSEPPTDPWAMTPQQAASALAAMSVKPSPAQGSPEAARDRLQAIRTDQEFLSDYFSGNADRAREVQELLERAGSDRVERELAGVAHPVHSDVVNGISSTERIAAYRDMRRDGHSDEEIAAWERGEKVPGNVFDDVEVIASENFDQEFLKALEAGDVRARRFLRRVMMTRNQGREGS